WLTRDAAARLAIRNHLPLAECAHFGKHMTAQALYDAVVARYSSPATAALGRVLLPYVFPKLSAFATVEDLVSHLRTSDARYRANVSAEFLDRNPPLMFITLYFIVTRLPDSLRSVRDHFLSLDPTSLTIDLLKVHLLEAETSAVAVGAARGSPRTPFFEGCSPSPLAPSYASAADADVPGAMNVGASFASAKRCSSKGKGGRGGGGGSGSGGGGSSGGSGGSGGGGGGGTGGGGGGSGGGGGGSGGSDGTGGGGTGGGRTGAQHGGSGSGQRQQQQRRSETQLPQQLREWLFERGTSGVLLRSGVAIFDLDSDVILSAMYALSVSVEGDCYRCVPPDPGIAAAALGASESGTLLGTAPAEALHTFTLDSGASRCFFRDSTTLTPLPELVPVRLADPSGGPVVARSSTILPFAALQDAMVTTTTPGGQRVSICTCTWTGRHLATFTRRPGSSLYTLATEPPQVAASAQVSASGQEAPPCSCRLLSHQTLLWHHRLGHPSLPRLRGMNSRLLVSGLPRTLPPLPPSPAPPCLPCVEGQQRAAPHSSSFPPTTAPLQTLHMDVWGPALVSGQGRERYFLLVVDDYMRYITVFPLRSKGLVVDVLIPWIHTVCLQLHERFRADLHILRLHSDRGGEFSSDLLRDFCHGEGILQSFTLLDSPQQNGIAEHRIGLVMEVAPFSVAVCDPPPGAMPSEVAVDSGAARRTASRGVEPWGAEPGGAKPGGAEPGGAEIGGAEPVIQLHEWLVRCARLRSEASRAGGAEAAGAGGAGVSAGAGVPGGTAVTGRGGARTQGTRAAGTGGVGGDGAGDPTEPGAAGAGGARAVGTSARGAGAGGAGAGGTGTGGIGAGGAGAVDPGGTVWPRPYIVPLLQQVLGVPSFTGLTPPLLCPSPDQSQPSLQPAFPLPSPSPFTEHTSGLT
ncbi:unnamed protein product, partial [Closterium sp. NIES-54]